MNSIHRNIILLIIMLVAFSCTRQADKRPLADATLVEPSTITDTKLPLKPPPSPGRITTALKFSGIRYSTTEFFRLVDTIQGLAEQTKDDQISGLAKGLYAGFYGNPANFTKVSFENSILTAAIIGEGEPEIKKQATQMDKELRELVNQLRPLLASSQRVFPWPNRLADLDDGLPVVDSYVAWLLERIPQLKISHTMQRNTVMGIRTQYEKLRPTLSGLIDSMKKSRRLKESLAVVNRALKEFKVKLPPKEAKLLSGAGVLSEQIEYTEDAQDALALLITVWRLQDPNNRGDFQKISPELYDFFSDKSEDQLDCLAKKHCLNPVLGIQKMVIFKKLNEYGVEKISAQVDQSVHRTLVDGAKVELAKLLPQLPQLVRDQVEGEAFKFLKLIASINKDVKGFVRPRLSEWTKRSFRQSLRGIEVPEVQVTLSGRDSVKVAALVPAASQIQTGASQIGLSLALAHKFLPESDGAQLRAAILEPVMKLLAIGGFRMPQGKPFPSFLLAIDGEPRQVFDIKQLMTVRTSFAVPDKFSAGPSFLMNRNSASKSVSVSAQADLLRGVSRQIHFLRDWESNQFDTSIGSVRMNELLKDIPGGDAVDGALFPKDILFALSLGNAGAILQNLVLDLSPAFLFLDKGEILWGNQYQEIKGAKVSTVAGLVSLVNGKRDSTVRTSDIARYVLALDEFMGATESMEKTNSALLRTPTNDGKSNLISDLLEIRKKLMLLQMGLTNFLVHIAQQPGGSLAGTFELGGALKRSDGGNLHLEDQVLAIRALLASAARLELPLFRWAALDAFYGLNKQFFDPNRQFYASEVESSGKPVRAARLLEIAMTLQAGEELSTYMPSETRQQWERLSAPWLRALQEL